MLGTCLEVRPIVLNYMKKEAIRCNSITVSINE